jgi:hypothetical protein
MLRAYLSSFKIEAEFNISEVQILKKWLRLQKEVFTCAE